MKRIKKHNMQDEKGNADSLENYLKRNPHMNTDSRINPDSLETHDHLWGDSGMTRPQELMGEAIAHLQGRQREVYHLTMREGRTHTETGEILGISRDAVKDYKERAIKFITAYCRAIIVKEQSNEAV